MKRDFQRALDQAGSGQTLGPDAIAALLQCSDDELPSLLERARTVRDQGLATRGLDGIVTYSRKVFIPLTKLCRYRCSYCTFVQTRADVGAEYLEIDEVVAIAQSGREWGCTEALFTLGESPEVRHAEAGRWLSEHRFADTVDYLRAAAAAVVARTGLLPHANPGAITLEQMDGLRRVTASQGLMMEQLTDRLLQPGQAHAGAAGKARQIRLEQLDFAHQSKAPFTTGLLIGIGETVEERAATMADIASASRGQIQEVIVQNFRAKSDTPMREHPDAATPDMIRAIAAVRLAVGPTVAVQAPPNLTPGAFGAYLDAGIDDWGGVSPVTVDHVNPEMPWPDLDALSEQCSIRGFTLRQRLPVHPGFITDASIGEWIHSDMTRHVLAASDAMGLAREERWYAGEGWTPVLRAGQPTPKRRALAIAANHPDRAAADVSDQAVTGGCGDVGGEGAVGFDEMLPEIECRPVFAHERADCVQGAPHPWIAPYVISNSKPSRAVGDLIARASDGERLSVEHVERLFRTEGPDLAAVLTAADELRREVNGDDVSYVVNRNITYTNVCHTGCGFCGFARPVGHEDGYYFDPDLVGAKALEAWNLGATEVCIQGGIHPENTGQIYLDIVAAVKRAAPEIHLHGFSPLEVTVGASTLGLSLSEFIPMLADAGLDSMPGTAAEILDDRVRPKITPEKLSADDWLEVMRTAHRSGIRSTSTIMFGHVDDPTSWAGHLLALRDLQSETGGFTEIVPLPFVHHRSPIFMRGASRTGPTWRECLKMHAVARLVLNPLITNIQASWVKLGVEGVKACLSAGVNDFGGTLMEEHISRMAGASHGLGLSAAEIETAILEAGRRPMVRTTLYGVPTVTGL